MLESLFCPLSQLRTGDMSQKISMNQLHITGFVKGLNGNAGIVEIDTPHGRKAYSLVMLMERQDYQTIEGDAANWFEIVSLHMRRISEITFAYISNRYESYNECGHSQLIRYAKLALAPRPLQASL